MSRAMTDSVWGDEDLKGSEKYVLLALADNLNATTGHLFPSFNYLAERCGLSRRTIIRAVKKLERDGYLLIERSRRPNGSFTSNSYTIRDPRNVVVKLRGGGW